MANQEQLEIVKKGVETWNKWRQNNRSVEIDLSGADLSKANLSGIDLSGANLFESQFSGADLSKTNLVGATLNKADLRGANLTGADIYEAHLSGADLSKAILIEATLNEADLSWANISGADLTKANINWAHLGSANLSGANLNSANLLGSSLNNVNLSGAHLIGADLYGANLYGANLSGANLYSANLVAASCIETNFCNANISNSLIYGISIWDVKSKDLIQNNLIITREDKPVVTVDNLKIAQFIYLLLNNQEIRDVLGTISKKAVLILGRFTPERKKILDSMREKLRELNYVPIMFDFEKVASRDFTETIKILAGMSRFVIADISDPSSIPLELGATVPDYKIPFIPLIQSGKKPFAMFKDLSKYPWMLKRMTYKSESDLIKGFQKGIIDKALEVEQKLKDTLYSEDEADDISNYF